MNIKKVAALELIAWIDTPRYHRIICGAYLSFGNTHNDLNPSRVLLKMLVPL